MGSSITSPWIIRDSKLVLFYYRTGIINFLRLQVPVSKFVYLPSKNRVSTKEGIAYPCRGGRSANCTPFGTHFLQINAFRREFILTLDLTTPPLTAVNVTMWLIDFG